MLWGCNFGFCGVRSLVPVDGMMNSDKYVDVIQRKVIPHMRDTFPEGGGHFSKILSHAMHKKNEEIFQETECKRFRMAWEFT